MLTAQVMVAVEAVLQMLIPVLDVGKSHFPVKAERVVKPL